MIQDVINLQYTTIKDPLPDFIYDGLKEYSKNANGYKPQPKELIEKIAEKYSIFPEMIFLTAGIDEAIQMFALSYGKNAFVFTPTYTVYKDVEEFGGKLTRIPSIVGTEYVIDTKKISDATLIYLANPNNPSGITSTEKVMELVKNNDQAMVVIDEAYGNFADLSVLDQVKNFPHMAVLRSFSKGYGMAGNRIGFIVASPNILKIVKEKTTWANVSYLSVGAATVALDHEEYFTKMREDINKRRDEFVEFLVQRKFAVIPSKINAVLLKFVSEEEGQKFVDHLSQNGFVVSHGNGNSNMGMDKSFVRIAIGTKEQMEKLCDVIDK